MKNKIMIIGIILVIVVSIGIISLNNRRESNLKKDETLSDAVKFSQSYKEVGEDNVFVYRDVDDIIDIMEHGTGVVYLGYPECPWCQAYVPYLNEVAKEVGISKIYYCNTKEVKENNMDKYNKLVSLLHDHLQYNDEGKEWIYVPNVSFHINGKVIGNNYETSKDTHNIKDPKEYWTIDEVTELKNNLKEYMTSVLEASGICTDCNK